MSPSDVPGVVSKPLYTWVPCVESTARLADYLYAQSLGSISEIEVGILRWLCDNGMVIVKRN